jgi:hypothetical protein
MFPRSLVLVAILSFLLVLLLSGPLAAEDGWVFQGAVGVVENLETSLTIRQSGSPDIEVDADYETRPFESPLYYMLRAGRWRGRAGWEIELVHHKLFLPNPPAEVHDFSISHGYNLLTVNRAWEARWLILRAGAGVVVAHPENTVRSRTLDPSDTNLSGGYHLTGPVLQLAAEKRFALGERWFIGLEGKITGARAEVPVAGGDADVPNVAFHGLVGIGWRAR